MTDTGWDDYIAGADTGVADVQDAADDLATTVAADPDAPESAQLDAIDMDSAATDASTDQYIADGQVADASYEADQAQSWQDYADGAAAQGLDDLAENAQNTADSYAGSAADDYSDAAATETDVAGELDTTATEAADVSSDYAAADTSYDAADTSYDAAE